METLPSLSALTTAQLASTRQMQSPGTGAQDKAKESAQAFEGMLWVQMMQVMRKTIEPSGLFGEAGEARNTYDYLFDQAIVASAMKGGKSLGLAEKLERAWQQGSSNPRLDLISSPGTADSQIS